MELGRRDEALADAEVGVELAKRSRLWREQMLCEALVARLIGDLDAFGPLLAEMDRVKAMDEALIMREFYGQALLEADDEAAARTVWLDALETAVDRGYGTAARRLRVLLNEVENG
jgi:predicted negative regulator of RcsB-dependent stress response